MQIDPAKRGKLPKFEPPTRLPENGPARGWQLKIPGGRPLATPALADGRLFVGGGFGSYEFYALDADSGQLRWQYQTSDDGPTAAVVQDGYVVFNTESCELEVLTVTGQPVWKHWLGDPLMSIPAVARGRVFMAYPDTRGDGEHYLACFELTSGRRLWRTRIAGEIITAPVLDGDAVYFATLDGTLYCCGQDDGQLRWQEASNATSSPVVVDGKCYFSQREEVPAQGPRRDAHQREHCAAREVHARAETRAYRSTSRRADYLDHGRRQAGSSKYAATAAYDAGVGFAAFKGSAKMHQAMRNLGHGHVASIWAYQGSKPFFRRGRLYSTLGDTVHCVEADSDRVVWKKKLYDGGAELLDSVVTPPVLVSGKVFVASADGDLLALCAETGQTVWHAQVGEPVDFQPAVAQGRIYVPTRSGSLYCLETGDPHDDGWLMWGATPAHNGLSEASVDAVVL